MQPGNWVKLDLGIIEKEQVKVIFWKSTNIYPKQTQYLKWRKHQYHTSLESVVEHGLEMTHPDSSSWQNLLSSLRSTAVVKGWA